MRSERLAFQADRHEAATLRFIDKIESSADQRLMMKMCVYFVKTASARNLLCTGTGSSQNAAPSLQAEAGLNLFKASLSLKGRY